MASKATGTGSARQALRHALATFVQDVAAVLNNTSMGQLYALGILVSILVKRSPPPSPHDLLFFEPNGS